TDGCARSIQRRRTTSRDRARVLLRGRILQGRRERRREGPPPFRGAGSLLASGERATTHRALPRRRDPIAPRESRRQHLSLWKPETGQAQSRFPPQLAERECKTVVGKNRNAGRNSRLGVV